MCGIFGWAVDANEVKRPKTRGKLTSIAAILSVLNDGRGGQAWGWYAPIEDRLRKGLGKLAEHRASRLAAHSTLLAHTRLATHGAATDLNCAHPFKIGSLVGAHNGVLSNHDELNKAHDRRFAVDSQHIFAHLAESKPLVELRGYGAIEYASPGEDSISLGRFNGGTLAVADLGFGCAWSSDSQHLKIACKVSGLRYDPWQVVASTGYLACPNGLVHSGREYVVGLAPVRQDWRDGLVKDRLPIGYGQGSMTSSRADSMWDWSEAKAESSRNSAYDYCHVCERTCGCDPACGVLAKVEERLFCHECYRACHCR